MDYSRKYKKSVGEDPGFDRDGALRDRPLTRVSAAAMVADLQQRVPELGSRPITVEFVMVDSRSKNGDANASTRHIRLLPRGQQEKTLLHELAHIMAPSEWNPRWRCYDRHGDRFKAACRVLERAWKQLMAERGTPIVAKPVDAAPLPALEPLRNWQPFMPPALQSLDVERPARLVPVSEWIVTGDRVRWSSPKHGSLEGQVVSAYPGCRARVKSGDGREWYVPQPWLKKI